MQQGESGLRCCSHSTWCRPSDRRHWAAWPGKCTSLKQAQPGSSGLPGKQYQESRQVCIWSGPKAVSGRTCGDCHLSWLERPELEV